MSSRLPKLAPRTFRIEWDLHAWSGIIASTFLFVIFFCGIFALIHEELHTWQDPALHVAAARSSGFAPSFDALLALTRKHIEIPRGADVGFALDGARIGHAYVSHADTQLDEELTFDLASGALVPEHTRLADELYLMHFFYRVPGGQQAAGVLAAGLFVAVVSGLLIHLKDLERQWWRFRPRLRLRYCASDIHKVLGVFGLPFALMFGWTGALLGLWNLVLAGVTGVAFGGDAERAFATRGEEAWQRSAADKPAEMLSLDALAASARNATDAGQATITWLGTQLYGDERALTRVYFEARGFDVAPYAALETRSGRILRTQTAGPASAGFERALVALHYASYAGLSIKLLYALLALAACAVIITGNLVWLERRDPGRARRGNRLVERLTVGMCAGCVLSVASYFAINRALPRGLAARADWELGVYLAVWAIAALSAFAPRWSARQHAIAQGALASALFGSVVIADVLTLDVSLANALARGVPGVCVVETVLVLLSVFTGALSWQFARRRSRNGE